MTALLLSLVVASAHLFGGIAPGAATANAIVRNAFLAGGTPFQSKDGRFSFTFPDGFSEPSPSTMPLETAVGNLKMKVFTSTKGSGSVFLAAYIDYPKKAFTEGTEVMLDGAENGAMENLGGTVDTKHSIAIDGNPGRSLVFHGNNKGTDIFGRVDYYIVKPRLYQILYLTDSQENLTDDNITNAFSSFALTKGKSRK
ncbi:MAG: hypothetical protein JST22_07030 [Bacteroidetes bacterium]|nr:hypothetical protein [Bacteroidota bacterium]